MSEQEDTGSTEQSESVEPADRTEKTPELVPMWLAAVVLVLLLAVMGVGGYVLRIVMTEQEGDASVVELEIRQYEQAVQDVPDDADSHLSLGFAYQQDGRLDEALAQYDLVLEYRPNDPAANYNMGVILLELDRDDEAEERLWDVLEVDEGHVLAAKALGELYAGRGEYRSLMVAVEPVVEAHETAADLQYLMGLAHENLGNLDEAEVRYSRALEYYPDMPEAKEGLRRLGIDP